MGEFTKLLPSSSSQNDYPAQQRGQLPDINDSATKSLTRSFEGALVAQVTYKSTNGTLQIGDE